MSCADDEGADVYREQIRKARIEHACCACSELIRAGDRYQVSSGVWDGQGRHFKHCLRCAKILTELAERGQNPVMTLDCGHEWKEMFDGEPPPEIQALAFMNHEEIQAIK